MKCGREMESGSFCADCLADMQNYPVKPNTVVLISNREKIIQARKLSRRRKEPTEKEKLARYERQVQVLTWVNGILAILLAGALVLCLLEYRKTTERPLGQNYTAVTTATQPAEN